MCTDEQGIALLDGILISNWHNRHCFNDSDFDIVAEAAGQSRSVVKTFKSIMISNALVINLDSVNGEQAVLSGVEIIAE